MSDSRALGVVALLLVCAALVAVGAVCLGPMDRCLDAGGCWDSARDRCEYEDQSRCTLPDR